MSSKVVYKCDICGKESADTSGWILHATVAALVHNPNQVTESPYSNWFLTNEDVCKDCGEQLRERFANAYEVYLMSLNVLEKQDRDGSDER